MVDLSPRLDFGWVGVPSQHMGSSPNVVNGFKVTVKFK